MYHSEKMLRVNRKHPCPICGKHDWCGYSADETVAVCMRVQSEHPAKNGGWTHVLKETPKDDFFRRINRTPVPEPEVKPIDVIGMMAMWRQKTSLEQRRAHASSLGVSTEALTRLDAVWAAEYAAWAFPMRNENGDAVGIRLRADDGRKWAVTGSKSGLFIPSGVEHGKQLLICEGPTDTAAALTLGYDVIGRPSCQGNTDTVKKWLETHLYGEIVIIADNDAPDKTGRRAGQDGAKNLASAIDRPVRIVVLPVKDIRSAVKAGITKAFVDGIIRDAKLQKFKKVILCNTAGESLSY
jgi:hypothetical protein